MTTVYQVTSQLTGLPLQVTTFEEAKALRQKLLAEYVASIEHCFDISVLTQNSDGSWTQALADANGRPIVKS